MVRIDIFNFQTVNSTFINAAVALESQSSKRELSAMPLHAGPVVGGLSAGGTVTAILVSP